jgi:hypothetical protein
MKGLEESTVIMAVSVLLGILVLFILFTSVSGGFF